MCVCLGVGFSQGSSFAESQKMGLMNKPGFSEPQLVATFTVASVHQEWFHWVSTNLQPFPRWK